MDSITKLAGPIVTLVGSVAPVAIDAFTKPKMPTLDTPTPKATPLMPAPDDDRARAAALQKIAKRSAASGRSSTQMYERESLG